MDNSHPLSTPTVVRSLDINTDPFRPQENDEELLGDETLYLSAIGALMYLANNTRPDIFFAVRLKDSVPPQQKDIGMVLNTYFDIFRGP